MLLGGGYYGQRLNKIYRGRGNLSYFLSFILILIVHFLLRERDGARDLSHSQANDQTVRPRKAGWRTLWRFRDTCRLYITHDRGKGMVRRHGWRRTILRDCRVICLGPRRFPFLMILPVVILKVAAPVFDTSDPCCPCIFKHQVTLS